MFTAKQRVPLLDIGGQGYILSVREGVLEMIEDRLSRVAGDLIDDLGGDGAGADDLAAIIHVAIGPGPAGEAGPVGDTRPAGGLSEQQISHRIRPQDLPGLRAKIRAFVITAQFCRDLAEMEQARQAARWLGRVEHRFKGAGPQPR